MDDLCVLKHSRTQINELLLEYCFACNHIQDFYAFFETAEVSKSDCELLNYGLINIYDEVETLLNKFDNLTDILKDNGSRSIDD